MGEALRGALAARGEWRRAAALVLTAAAALGAAGPAKSALGQEGVQALRQGRFTVVASPRDEPLARSMLAAAVQNDTFPGMPRPEQAVRIDIAPDQQTFREWIGVGAPEWGAAFAFPGESRIVMQGRSAGSDAGDPIRVLRHELAHLALHEYLGDVTTRWFDEGYASYAAGEWSRDQVVATNLALALRGMPSLAALDSGFYMGAQRADAAYALAYRAVAELAAVDPERGLTLLLSYWKESGNFEAALRRAYGMTTTTFEDRWRRRTRRRYGGVALFADAAVGAAVLLFLVGPFVVLRRRRDRLRMAALRRADAEQERRERESMLEALLRSGGTAGDETPNPSAPPSTSS